MWLVRLHSNIQIQFRWIVGMFFFAKLNTASQKLAQITAIIILYLSWQFFQNQIQFEATTYYAKLPISMQLPTQISCIKTILWLLAIYFLSPSRSLALSIRQVFENKTKIARSLCRLVYTLSHKHNKAGKKKNSKIATIRKCYTSR